MRLIFTLLASLFALSACFAQDEQLTSLKMNPALYYSTQKYQHGPHQHRYLVDKGNTIMTTDTLQLPFIDDFSTVRTRSYNWAKLHITDSFFNVVGACLDNEGVSTTSANFYTTTTWNYTFDVVHQRLDSTPKQPLQFTSFGSQTADCFSGTPQTILYWPDYYTYTFDSTDGRPIDSLEAADSAHLVSLNYAPVIYFAQGEPGTLWFDNYAYVNTTYPINPPTIGVATLDALDEFGFPYNNSSNSTYGTADYLTSKPIDISGITGADTAGLYLSFFFEPQGLGDYPDYADSLIVEFRDNGGNWNVVWSDTGFVDPSQVPDTFQQVLVHVPNIALPYTYYYNTFQFRFRNKASLFGNNNHWHIDYVRFDKNRSDQDFVIHDMAFVYPINTILKNYTQLPAVQFNNPGDLKDADTLTIHNLDPNAITNPPATDFARDAFQTYPTQAIVSNLAVQTFNAQPYNYNTIQPATDFTIPAVSSDSVAIVARAFINPNDSRASNDTLEFTQVFGHVLAYDDGSAEKAYGLTGLDLKKFAYEFVLNKPDTLVGFQILFTQVEGNVSDLIFNFEAWDSLRMNDLSYLDTPFYSRKNQKPFYIDSVNGFATYKLDTPVIVYNKVYMGWAQTDERRLQVGYDLNSRLGRNHMFIYTENTWKPSTISPDGSPMIRLLFDSAFEGRESVSVGVKDLARNKEELAVYPNPTTGYLNFKSDLNNSLFEVTLYNAIGQQSLYKESVSNSLYIGTLPDGVYILTARNIQTGKVFHNKIIKTSN